MLVLDATDANQKKSLGFAFSIAVAKKTQKKQKKCEVKYFFTEV